MSVDIKDVIREVSFFFRFDLRRKGAVIDAKPTEEGWEVQAELLDPRPDLSSSYKKVYDQNIYRVDVGPDLSILACEKIGERQKDGEIRLLPSAQRIRKTPPPKAPSRSEPPTEKKVLLDPALVGSLANEISQRVSLALRQGKGPVTEEELAPKGAFIDPHEPVDLDYNFERVGKVEQQEEGNISNAVQRLKRITSVSKKKTKNTS